MTEKYQQLMLFPPTLEEKLFSKVGIIEDKLDRQRKSQFAKIGKLQKGYDELKHEFETLKASICKNTLHAITECEILDLKTGGIL